MIRGPNTLLRNNNQQAAEQALKLALVDSPRCVEANLALARIYGETNRAPYAVPHIHMAATGDPRKSIAETDFTPAVAAMLAANMRQQTKIVESVELWKIAAAISPNDPKPTAGYLSALDALGDYETAMDLSSQALQKFPDDLDVLHSVAAITAGTKDFAGAAAMITRGNMRAIDYLARGRYRDRAGDFDGAWSDWVAGKTMLRKAGKLVFEQAGFDHMTGELAKMAAPKTIRAIPQDVFGAWETPPVTPLFVTGFPRSGTTMVETALAAHSAITAGDELPMISEVIRSMPAMLAVDTPYPAAMMGLSYGENFGALSLMRKMYMDRARFRLMGREDWSPSTEFFTDKMPLNEMHIPLIRRLFPTAPIYWVYRHPLDVLVSNFSYYIAHGHGYSSTVPSIAKAIVAVDALVQKYRELFPGKIFPINYENFVGDHEATLTAALAHAKLSYEPACGDFHNSGRFSRTISHRQIKEPVYERSIGRWENYRDKIPPAVIDMVRPICEREGWAL